jgi:hypothetical protein
MFFGIKILRIPITGILNTSEGDINLFREKTKTN